jgi:DNA repair photolyase
MSAEPEYRDALPVGTVRGRGAGINPGNRFEDVRLHVLGDHLDEVVAENPDGTQVVTRVYPDRTKTIINKVESPDVGFDWTINPYRGCEHGCIYCYARPGHEYLGWSLGLDFETKIMAKYDGPELLRAELAAPKWKGEKIVMSGVTDPYQPIEAKLGITRRILEILAECRQPVSFITKNRLILRDLDLLSRLHAHRAVSVAVSITSLDPKLARVMEPRASAPAERLRTVRELAGAGIPVSVMTAPIIPGLNDQEIPALLEAAADAGARNAGYVMLRLPFQIKDIFLDWLRREFPERASRVEAFIREARGGALYDARPKIRMRGEGVRADQIAATFKLFKRRYGLDRPYESVSGAAFRKPEPPPSGRAGEEVPGQMRLF